MDPYYKLLSLTLVLLFSSTIFAHRIHPSDEYHANIPQSKSMLIIPTESDITWWRYLPSPRDHMSDGKNSSFYVMTIFNGFLSLQNDYVEVGAVDDDVVVDRSMLTININGLT